MFKSCCNSACNRFNFANTINFITKKLNPNRCFTWICWKYIKSITIHSKRTTRKINIISLILVIYKFHNHSIARNLHTRPERNRKFVVFTRLTKTINTRNRSNNNHIFPFKKRTSCRMAKLIYFIIYWKFFFNISVRTCNICFRLIIVIIWNKIVYWIIRKKFSKFIAKLSCKGFIVSNNKSWSLNFFNNICHSKSLTASGNTQEHLCSKPIVKTLHKTINCLRLVTRWLILRYKFKFSFISTHTI